MTDHSQCLMPIPVYALDILPAGLPVLVGAEIWTSVGGWADGGWLWSNDRGDRKTSRVLVQEHPAYQVGWEPPTEKHPMIREMPNEPAATRWLAWTMTDPIVQSPLSWHPTEIEARAAAWDRIPHEEIR